MTNQSQNEKAPTQLPIRALAIDTLHTCIYAPKDAQAAVDDTLTKNTLQIKDKALLTELVYGTLRLKIRIDFILSSFLKKPQALPQKAILALNIASYEILFLEKIPHYASVHWAVEYAKKAFAKQKLAPLFNAVLRKITKVQEENLYLNQEFYAKNTCEIETLSNFYSCPQWIVKLWLNSYPKETALAYLKSQALAPAKSITLTDDTPAEILKTLKNDPLCIATQNTSFAFPAGYTPEILSELNNNFLRGSFVSRQTLAHFKPENFLSPIWDACSGRGGKTRILHELLPQATILASDVHTGRLKALKNDLEELTVFQCAANKELPFTPNSLQTIILDLPCSGLGVLARRPDIKYKRTQADLVTLAELAKDILTNTFTVLAPKGKLLIITCTLNPSENEQLAQNFIADTKNAQIIETYTTPADSQLGEFFWACLIEKI